MLSDIPNWAWTSAFFLAMFVLVIISFLRINSIKETVEHSLAWDEQTVTVFLSASTGLSNTSYIKPAVGSLTQPAGSTIWSMVATSMEQATSNVNTNWGVKATSYFPNVDDLTTNTTRYDDISPYVAAALAASTVTLRQYLTYKMDVLSPYTPVDRQIYFQVILDTGSVTNADPGNVQFAIQYQGVYY